MKLTTEQIEYIESTLVLKGLEFEDIKLEVTDHIASEIEDLMEQNTLSFEDNLNIVIDKWMPQLQSSFSFWINYRNSAPYIVTNKCNRMLKSVLMFTIIWGFLTSIVVTIIIKLWQNEEVIYFLNSTLKTLSVVVFIILIYTKYKVNKSGYSSTYRYLFNRYVGALLMTCFNIVFGIFSFNVRRDPIDFHFFLVPFFPIAILFMSGYYIQLLNKHFQFEKKYAKSE
jgi:hypothetical protein